MSRLQCSLVKSNEHDVILHIAPPKHISTHGAKISEIYVCHQGAANSGSNLFPAQCGKKLENPGETLERANFGDAYCSLTVQPSEAVNFAVVVGDPPPIVLNAKKAVYNINWLRVIPLHHLADQYLQ